MTQVNETLAQQMREHAALALQDGYGKHAAIVRGWAKRLDPKIEAGDAARFMGGPVNWTVRAVVGDQAWISDDGRDAIVRLASLERVEAA